MNQIELVRKNKDYIDDLYFVKGLNGGEIAKIIGVSCRVMTDYLYKERQLQKHMSFSKKKVCENKETIRKLLQEGRSYLYIAKLLDLDRKVLADMVKEWNFERIHVYHLSPRLQKILNKEKDRIAKLITERCSAKDIATSINVPLSSLMTVIHADSELSALWEEFSKPVGITKEYITSMRRRYYFAPLCNEKWERIESFRDGKYFISNMGRIKRYLTSLNCYRLIKGSPNGGNYLQVFGGQKVHRLVAKYFIPNDDPKKNQVNHINGDRRDNRARNLEWCTASENLRHSYQKLNRKKSIAYTKFGKFKKIVLDDKYQFKTIRALARFLGVSETQATRYITKETPSKYQFKFVY